MQVFQLPPSRSFDALFLGLSENGFAILDDFIDAATVLNLLHELREAENEFQKAGVGKNEDYQILHTQRGDYIKWLESGEASPHTNQYLLALDELRLLLNRHCFLGLQDFEVHFTKYPIGTRYVRHVDAFSNDDNRRISIVLYLNPGWHPKAGGELILYPDRGKQGEVTVAPLAGRLAVFESTISHEVLPAKIERHSITGWMLKEKRFF
ncbi:MAG: 2OG-Fe(II) oxygenase [Cryomorphaceae bacterium]|nr:2OG-Fe(II) oxygenase [Cryomorphaceae bacterium]